MKKKRKLLFSELVKRPMKCFSVEVTYPGKYYFDTPAEETIRKVAGYSDSSGMGFGTRDHSWHFKNKGPAAKKAAKLRRIKSIKGFKVKILPSHC